MDLMGYSSSGTLEYGISRSSVIRALSCGMESRDHMVTRDNRQECSVE